MESETLSFPPKMWKLQGVCKFIEWDFLHCHLSIFLKHLVESVFLEVYSRWNFDLVIYIVLPNLVLKYSEAPEEKKVGVVERPRSRADWRIWKQMCATSVCHRWLSPHSLRLVFILWRFISSRYILSLKKSSSLISNENQKILINVQFMIESQVWGEGTSV